MSTSFLSTTGLIVGGGANKKAADIRAMRCGQWSGATVSLSGRRILLVKADQLFGRDGVGVKPVDHWVRFLKIDAFSMQNC